MYQRVLVTLDHSSADEVILTHIEKLHESISFTAILLHVADGWVARHFNELQLKESEEIRQDRIYLNEVAKRLQSKGIETTTHLSMGEPADEIIRFVGEHQCDLIAMSTHGHRFLADLMYGSTVTKVRHQVAIPVLLLKVPKI